ncbi:MAG: hypothetical protein AVDCRST_MAG68-538 [uncultured Gemmatimonadetes bacterium]|uniref:Uncharacterized protein n=1 Tax=uncultured Gemmatimonadota bacterium TaxID=203437 RepID=A0A6J4K949_9BACT|nr:MAG: hypothetical protein AVDCRST_MAG68-538 [uncultured Gemmatimonadota bacterium]
MTDRDGRAPPPVHEMRFWDWWCRGVVAAGVEPDDLPRLTFAAAVDQDPETAGAFRVHYDQDRRLLQTEVLVREDLCSTVPLHPSAAPPGVQMGDLLALMPAGARVATNGVVALALQCAFAEQFTWRFWTRTRDTRKADRAATRRASWLVRRWIGSEQRYRTPGFARGVRPVRCAGRVWTTLDGDLVGEDEG